MPTGFSVLTPVCGARIRHRVAPIDLANDKVGLRIIRRAVPFHPLPSCLRRNGRPFGRERLPAVMQQIFVTGSATREDLNRHRLSNRKAVCVRFFRKCIEAHDEL